MCNTSQEVQAPHLLMSPAVLHCCSNNTFTSCPQALGVPGLIKVFNSHLLLPSLHCHPGSSHFFPLFPLFVFHLFLFQRLKTLCGSVIVPTFLRFLVFRMLCHVIKLTSGHNWHTFVKTQNKMCTKSSCLIKSIEASPEHQIVIVSCSFTHLDFHPCPCILEKRQVRCCMNSIDIY